MLYPHLEKQSIQKEQEIIRVNQSRTSNGISGQQLRTTYDYIVCGAGTSGSVVAGRLAANPDINVLLIEAGGTDVSEAVSDPNRWVTLFNSELHWNFKAEQNPSLNDRAIPYAMGKVLGGGSSINVGTWSRGHKADWNFYAEETGDDAWGYESVLSLYRKIEDWHGAPDPNYRGTGGPVYLQPAPEPHPFFEALLESAQSCGISLYENANGRLMEERGGCSLVDEIVRNGRRQSMFRSYVQPLLDEPNLVVLVEATVQRVVFEGNRAVGVEVVYKGESHRFSANREVILSMGAINTPKVLMLSGIGDPEELNQLEIPVIQALPGVGQNLHDHVAIGCVWEASDAPLPRAPRSSAVAFWKSQAELDAPNFYVYGRSGAFMSMENAARFEIPPNTWSLALGMRPASRGRVRLEGSNPDAMPKIAAPYLTESRDLADMMHGIEQAREIGNSPAFSSFTKRELLPAGFQGVDRERFVREGLVTYWHQCGTAKMGRDAMSVVDGKLRVHGIKSLRIADASVLPRVTTGNTMAPCVVIGEIAARSVLTS
jgi:choline dehydrogenase